MSEQHYLLPPLVWTAHGESLHKESLPIWCTYTGQSQDAVQSWGWLDAVHADDRERLTATWSHSLATRHLYVTSYRIRRFDGLYQTFQVQGIPVFMPAHVISEWVCKFALTDEKLRAEEANWETQWLYRLVFEQAASGIFCLALDGSFLRVNQQFCSMIGYTEEELLSLNMRTIEYQDDRETTHNAVIKLLTDQARTVTFEKRYVRKNGSLMWGKVTCALMILPSGEIKDYIVIVEDITRRIQMEEERAQLLAREQQAHDLALEQKQRLETIFESMTDSVFVYDRHGNVVQANSSARELFHLVGSVDYFQLPFEQRVQLYSVTNEDGELIPLEERPVQRILRGEVLHSSQNCNLWLTTPDGQKRCMDVTGAPLFDTQHLIAGGVMVLHDMTERRLLEMRVQKAFRALLKMADELFHISGQVDAEATGTDQEDVPYNMMKTLGLRLAELASQVLEGKMVGISLIEEKTQTFLPLAIAGIPAHLSDDVKQDVYGAPLRAYFDDSTIERLRKNEVVVCDVINLPNPRGSVYALYNMLLVPLILNDQLNGVFCVEKSDPDQAYTAEELSLAKAVAPLILLMIERERLLREWLQANANQIALREANRRFDEFLSIASHELRTPLTTIKGNVQLALRRLHNVERRLMEAGYKVVADFERVYSPLHYAEHRVNVQNRMISDLLDVSRIQSGKLALMMKQCNLIPLVQAAINDLRYLAPERTLHFVCNNDQPLMVIADEDRIGQVIHNYLTNALKYSPAETPITVYVEALADRVKVSVHDEGPGLDSEQQQKIWERFYRAEGIEVQNGGIGGGLGIGLHICRTIIEFHHGALGLESTPDHGSTFWFTLPLVMGKQTEQDQSAVRDATCQFLS